MSNKTRTYRKRERARQEKETRRKIVESVVELHRTVGPAKTTVTDVAKMAGVGRMTVYNHFPTETDLIEACSTHWSQQNPPPDPDAWAAIADPDQRLEAALRDLYRWYSRTEDMMGKVLRDAPIVPALGNVMEKRWFALIDSVIDILLQGRRLRGRQKLETRATIKVALDFWTWRSLTEEGLSDDAAASLATEFVTATRRAK